MPANWFTARFGSERLYVVDFDTAIGRTKVVHSPARGDDHVIQDRGKVLGRIRFEVAFFQVDGEDPHLERYRRFLKLLDDDEPRVLVHPLHPSTLATLGDCQLSGGAATDEVRVSAEFLPVGDITIDALLDGDGGIVPAAGEEAVTAAAAEAETALADAGLASSTPSAATAAATSWAEAEEVDSRSVYLELASVTSQIDSDISTLGLEGDLAFWETYAAMIGLRSALRGAALASASPTPRTFDLTVAVPTPVRVLCARAYGAADADARTAEVLALNDLRSPLLVGAGTILKMPAIGVSR